MHAPSQTTKPYLFRLEPTELTRLNGKDNEVMRLLRAAESWNLSSTFGWRTPGTDGCQQKVLPGKIVLTLENQALCEKGDLG